MQAYRGFESHPLRHPHVFHLVRSQRTAIVTAFLYFRYLLDLNGLPALWTEMHAHFPKAVLSEFFTLRPGGLHRFFNVQEILFNKTIG